MLQELVVVSLAAAIGWELIRYFTPVDIPARAAPVIVIAVALLFTLAFHFSVVMAFAGAGGVAVFHKITGSVPVDHVSYPLRRKKKFALPREMTRGSHRIPEL